MPLIPILDIDYTRPAEPEVPRPPAGSPTPRFARSLPGPARERARSMYSSR